MSDQLHAWDTSAPLWSGFVTSYEVSPLLFTDYKLYKYGASSSLTSIKVFIYRVSSMFKIKKKPFVYEKTFLDEPEA